MQFDVLYNFLVEENSTNDVVVLDYNRFPMPDKTNIVDHYKLKIDQNYYAVVQMFKTKDNGKLETLAVLVYKTDKKDENKSTEIGTFHGDEEYLRKKIDLYHTHGVGLSHQHGETKTVAVIFKFLLDNKPDYREMETSQKNMFGGMLRAI
jgi:hypothetical protein